VFTLFLHGLNYNRSGVILIIVMAVKKSKKVSFPQAEVKQDTKVPKWHMEEMGEGGEPLDPQEEKLLDWILKAVVFFVLGWLGLSVLLVIGGYFHLWG